MSECLCGDCIHWHERAEQKYSLKIGDCDKIPKRTPYDKYEFDGYSFEDENYDHEFDCFELKEQK